MYAANAVASTVRCPVGGLLLVEYTICCATGSMNANSCSSDPVITSHSHPLTLARHDKPSPATVFIGHTTNNAPHHSLPSPNDINLLQAPGPSRPGTTDESRCPKRAFGEPSKIAPPEYPKAICSKTSAALCNAGGLAGTNAIVSAPFARRSARDISFRG